jgi:2-hydroxy-6-oxonona-2,4-dienedioate hydrolase
MSSIWTDLLGSEVRFYDAGGVRTRCIEAGEGETIIFLHGVGGHAEAFARNVVPLSGKFRAIAIDYLGFGLTDKPAAPPTREDYVRHLVDFMDAAGIERAHLVGESLGGWVSFWTAIEHPERVGKLISVCGARLAVEEDEESARHVSEGLARLKALSARMAAEPSRENVRARLSWLFAHPDRDITDELVDIRWKLYQHEESATRLAATNAHVIRSGSADDDGFSPERLSQIEHEVLMLWTEFNPSTTAATAQRATAYLPHGTFRLMKDCGHWPQWENPDEFNEIVAEFLG